MAAESFGQVYKLTTQLRVLLDQYTKDTTLVELLQNADDAKAQRFKVGIDLRHHGLVTFQPELTTLQGPALIAYNTAVFTDDDWQSITNIGESIKRKKRDLSTAGQFGLGFNSVYHFTDFPCIASQHKLAIFDPHNHFFNLTLNPYFQSNGTRYNFQKVSDEELAEKSVIYSGFSIPGVIDCDLHSGLDGTIIRLPLRTEEHAKDSDIVQKPQTIEEMQDFLRHFCEIAPTMLLFLEHVEEIEVFEISSSGEYRQHLKVTIENIEDCRKARNMYSTLMKNNEFLQTEESKKSVFNVMLKISMGTKAATTQRYAVCHVMGSGKAQEMAKKKYEESKENPYSLRLVPWGGVAARLDDDLDKSQTRLFCMLPLPQSAAPLLPVHVNGRFVLRADRLNLKTEDDVAREWNKLLLKEVITHAYITLLSYLIEENLVSQDRLCKLYPTTSTPTGFWREYAAIFYRSLTSQDKVFLTVSNVPVSVTDAVFVQAENASSHVVKACQEGEVNLVCLPGDVHVEVINHSNGATLLHPRHICGALKSLKLSQALTKQDLLKWPQWLQNNETREALLTEILRGKDELTADDFINVPLVPLMSGGVGVLGQPYIMGSNDEYTILQRQDFISNRSEVKQLTYLKELKITVLNPQHVANLLNENSKFQVESNGDREIFIPWNEEEITREWLYKLWEYISSKDALAYFEKLPILPSDDNRLFAPYNVTTLLHPATKLKEIAWRNALKELQLCVVDSEFAAFCRERLVNVNEPKRLLTAIISAKVWYESNKLSNETKKLLRNHFSKYITKIDPKEQRLSQLRLLTFLTPEETTPTAVKINSQHNHNLDVWVACNKIGLVEYNEQEEALLKFLGVHVLSYAELFLRHYDKLLPYDSTDNVLKEILSCSACLRDENFKKWLGDAKIFRNSNGDRCRITELVDDTEPSLKGLFGSGDPDLVHPDLREHISVLRSLGLGKELTQELFINRVKSLQHLQPDLKRTRAQQLLSYLSDNWPRVVRDESDFITKVENIKWIPVLQRPETESLKEVCPWWYTESCDDMVAPAVARSHKLQLILGGVAPIVNVSGLRQDIIRAFKWDRRPTKDELLQQLRKLVELVENSWADLQANDAALIQMFTALYNQFNTTIVAELPPRWLYLGKGCIISPNKLYWDTKLKLATKCLTEDNERYTELLKQAGVKDSLETADLVGILNQISLEFKEMPLTEEKLNLVVYIADHLADIVDVNELGLFTLPDKDCIMREKSLLYYDDVQERRMHEVQNVILLHPKFSKFTAKKLGILSASQHVLKNENTWRDMVEFSQHEELHIRIRQLCQEYGEKQIVTEILQNAEDAKATKFSIVLDLRHHNNTQDNELSAFINGPSLTFYNNKVFTEEDMRSIREISCSAKHTDQIGHKGKGFNVVYYVTETPIIVTNDSVIIFDPQRRYLPQLGFRGSLRSTSTKWLTSTFEKLPFGLDCQSSAFNGTMIRLPLRTKKQARESKLRTEAFSQEHAKKLVEEAAAEVCELLLFLRHVSEIEILIIEPNGETNTLCRASKNTPQSINNGFTFSNINIATPISNESVEWVIFTITENPLPHASKPTIMSVAIPRNTSSLRCMEGKVFNFLPTVVKSGLSFHVNCPFELNEARTALAEASSYPKKAALNEQLRSLAIETLCRMLEFLCADSTLTDEIFYSLFPTAHAPDTFWQELYNQLLQTLFSRRCIRRISISDKPSPAVPRQTVFVSDDVSNDVVSALVRAECPLTRVPMNILQKWSNAKILTPSVCRELLRNTSRKHVGIPLEKTCFGEINTLLAVLDYCTNSNYDDRISLDELPLAVTKDGIVKCFSKDLYMLSSNDWDVLPNIRHKILEPAIADKIRTRLFHLNNKTIISTLDFSALFKFLDMNWSCNDPNDELCVKLWNLISKEEWQFVEYCKRYHLCQKRIVPLQNNSFMSLQEAKNSAFYKSGNKQLIEILEKLNAPFIHQQIQKEVILQEVAQAPNFFNFVKYCFSRQLIIDEQLIGRERHKLLQMAADEFKNPQHVLNWTPQLKTYLANMPIFLSAWRGKKNKKELLRLAAETVFWHFDFKEIAALNEVYQNEILKVARKRFVPATEKKVIPKDAPQIGFNKQFLVMRQELLQLYTSLSVEVLETPVKYLKALLGNPQFSNESLSKEEREYLYDYVEQNARHIQGSRQLQEMFRNFKFDTDNPTKLIEPTGLYHPSNAIANILIYTYRMSDKIYFPAPQLRGQTWIDLLLTFGMQTEVASDVVKEALVLNRASMSDNKDNIVLIAELFTWLLNSDSYSHVLDDSMRCIPAVDEHNSTWFAERTAIVHQDYKDLCYTTKKVLHPLVEVTKEQVMKFGIHPPKAADVARHARNILRDAELSFEEKMGKLLRCIEYINSQLENANIVTKEEVYMIFDAVEWIPVDGNFYKSCQIVRLNEERRQQLKQEYLEPYRYLLPEALIQFTHFLEVVGFGKDSTLIEVGTSILHDIERSSLVIKEKDQNYVCRLIGKLCELTPENELQEQASKLLVLTTQGKLKPATEIVYFDQDWHWDHVKDERIDVLCKSLTQYASRLGVKKLSSVVEEAVDDSVTKLTPCDKLSSLLTSAEFIAGLQRILASVPDIKERIQRIRNCKVYSCAQLKKKLIFSQTGEVIDTGNLISFYSITDKNELVIAENPENVTNLDMETWTAQAIVEYFDAPANAVIPLLTLLKTDPQNIEKVLDSLRVPRIHSLV